MVSSVVCNRYFCCFCGAALIATPAVTRVEVACLFPAEKENIFKGLEAVNSQVNSKLLHTQ